MWCCTALLSYFLIWIWLTLTVGVCWWPHFDICVELSYCTTALWTHWFQHEKGSHLMFCLLVYFVLGMLYLVLFTSLFPVSQSISCFWLTYFDLLWTIGFVFWSTLEKRGLCFGSLPQIRDPSGESYLYLARKLLEGWQKHNNRSKWL